MNAFEFGSVFFILAIYALAVPMPGPSLVVIARASIGSGRRAGSAAAFATSLGAALYALATLMGISVLVMALPWIVTIIQIAGGAYLLYLGVSLIRAQLSEESKSLQPALMGNKGGQSLAQIFRRSFLVSVGNPKMAAFFFGLFSPMAGDAASTGTHLMVLAGIILIDLVYHQALAQTLAAVATTRIARWTGRWLDAIAGGLMTVFGAGLLMRAALNRSP